MICTLTLIGRWIYILKSFVGSGIPWAKIFTSSKTSKTVKDRDVQLPFFRENLNLIFPSSVMYVNLVIDDMKFT
jgi:hypothetical protein